MILLSLQFQGQCDLSFSIAAENVKISTMKASNHIEGLAQVPFTISSDAGISLAFSIELTTNNWTSVDNLMSSISYLKSGDYSSVVNLVENGTPIIGGQVGLETLHGEQNVMRLLNLSYYTALNREAESLSAIITVTATTK